MDPIAVLRAVLGLALFPGGALLAAAAWIAVNVGDLPGRRRATLEEVAAIAAAAAACGLAPLPGSPLLDLPAAIAMPAILVLLAGAVVWGTTPDWPPVRVLAAPVALVPVLCLGATATTLSASTQAGLPGPAVGAARMLAALAILIAGPLLTCLQATETSRWSRAAVLSAVIIVALSLVVGGEGGGTATPLAAALVLAGVALYAGCLRLLSGARNIPPSLLVGAAAVASTAAVVILVLA